MKKKLITTVSIVIVLIAAFLFFYNSSDTIGGSDFYTFYRPQREATYDIVEKIEEGIGMLNY
jgi:uncharacterized protein YxeA